MPPRLAIAIPAYEEERLADFLLEIDHALGSQAERTLLLVVDDASPTDIAEALECIAPRLRSALTVHRNEFNRGHGPTSRRALELCVASGAELVAHVDGDGQFGGREIAQVVEAAQGEFDIALGVRAFRADPWFRKLLAKALRTYLRWFFAVSVRDPNSPLRCYRAPALADLLALLPENALIPSVYLNVVSAWAAMNILEVEVHHRSRLGDSCQGTMWGRPSRIGLIPIKLLRFSWQALCESWAFRRVIRESFALRMAPASR